MSLNPPMTLSPLGEAWTKHCEGLCLTPYPDNGKCSAGWGHWGAPCGVEITESQAEAWWEEDKARVELAINDQVEVDLAQCQFDALFDFAYNEGTGAFASSTLLRELNEGNKIDVPAQLRRWVYAGGRVNSGLAARREGEIVLWSGGNPLATSPAPSS